VDKKTLRAVNDELRTQDDTQNLGLSVQLVGTGFTGTVTFEASVDKATWVACPVEPLAGGATVTSATADGIWIASPGALGFGLQGLAFRARLSALTGGTVDVMFQPVGA
jgi:hypothetical protein